MTDARSLLTELASRGVRVHVDGDELVVRGPATPDLIERLRHHKQAVLDHLIAEPERPDHLFAASDAERAAGKPVYGPDAEPLESTDARQAWVNCMIVTYSARHHARHAAKLGPCPGDIAEIVTADAERLIEIII